MSHGCGQVEQAADGNQAVEKYKALKPDLVLMDIVMPLKSGIDALKEIRQFDSKARVVIASSVGTQSHLKEAIMEGAFDFLQKPIEEPQMEKLLENTLKAINQKSFEVRRRYGRKGQMRRFLCLHSFLAVIFLISIYWTRTSWPM